MISSRVIANPQSLEQLRLTRSSVVLTSSTQYTSHVLLHLLMFIGVTYHGQSSGFFSCSVQTSMTVLYHSKSIGTNSFDLHLHRRTSSMCSLHNTTLMLRYVSQFQNKVSYPFDDRLSYLITVGTYINYMFAYSRQIICTVKR
jgi:hypothetical protein